MNTIILPLQIIPWRLTLPNLEVFYPKIVAGTNPEAMERMNQQIYDLMQRLITSQDYYQNPQTAQVTGSFELKNNQRGVLSLTLINYTYHLHAAHGNTIIKSLTFDIATGKNYQLGELFKPNTNYQQRLGRIIEKQIRERQIPLLEKFPGVKPNQDYYIADKALVIYYQLYELTAYVYGLPMFPISVFEIQDIIKENSPLGVMLASN